MKQGLNGNQIKLIAIVAMTIDHLTWALFPGTQGVWYVFALHVIGRLTAPIMWFFIAEGCHFTRDIQKYAGRLFLFALVSHFAYSFAFGIPLVPFKTGVFNQTSVMWAYAWAVVIVIISRSEKLPSWAKVLITVGISLVAFPADWSSIAAMCPFYLYLHRGDRKRQGWDIALWSAIYALVYFLFIDRLYGLLQLCTCLAIPVLSRYNGRRGEWKGMKWLFYLYYPAHLVVIGMLRLALHGDISIIF